MKFATTLAKSILAIIVIIAFTGTAAARGMSVEVAESGAVGVDPVFRTPTLEMAQPLQIEILEKAPAVDMGFHPCDATQKSIIWNVFPEQPANDYFGKTPSIDMGFHPLGNVARIRTHEVAQPLQTEIVHKNPTEAVKQPPQCDAPCDKNPTEAVKQPPQCDTPCDKNPTEAVKQPPQCDTPCDRNPTEAVKQPPQCDAACYRNPTQALPDPLDIEFSGPTMKFEIKEPTEATIAIYSVSGRLVRRISERLSSGESSLTWDGTSDSGGRAASGVYFARVQANAQTGQGKLVLVR